MLRHSILFATAYLIIYTLLPFTPIPQNAFILMFSFSPIIVIYMVYDVLKNAQPSGKTFDQDFYDDVDIQKEQTS